MLRLLLRVAFVLVVWRVFAHAFNQNEALIETLEDLLHAHDGEAPSTFTA